MILASLMCAWFGMSCPAPHLAPKPPIVVAPSNQVPAGENMPAPFIILPGVNAAPATTPAPFKTFPVITGPFAAPAGYNVTSASVLVKNQPAVLYSSATAANYGVSQWNSPASMGAWQAIPGGVQAVSPYSSATVKGGSITLYQDGSKTPCGKELDLFVSPSPAAKHTPFPPMSSVTAFSVAGALTASVSAASGTCPGLHGGADYELEFVDTAVQPEQMLWYQVQLQSTHDLIPTTQVWTGAQEPSPHASTKLVNFFIVDSLAEYGAAQVAVGVATPISLNLLPRLTAIIAAGAYGMDADPSHWTLAGETFGQAVWNDTVAQSTWSGWVPQWSVK